MTDQMADLVPAGGAEVLATASGAAVVTRPMHQHPEPRQYVLIAVVLVVITGLEVGTSYLEGDVNSNLLIAALGVMAAIKFYLVAMWYMHLRTDSKIFRRFFLLGLIAAPISLRDRAAHPARLPELMPRVGFPAWQPHPDVWLVVALLVAAYAVAVVRVGPKYAMPGIAVVTRFQLVCFGAGAAALWIASDYPIHDLGEQYLFSVHMVQHLVYQLVAAPLLLLGTPAWMARRLLSPPGFQRAMRWIARFFPATVLFNFVMVFIHVPAIIDLQLRYGSVHAGMHALILLSSIVVWMPILSPLPEVPRLFPPIGMLYLFLQSVIPTVPASFLTFGSKPLYHVYTTFPRLWGISALSDMQTAGLIMKLGGGLTIWIVLTIVFFRWFRNEEAGSSPAAATSRELDRELVRMGMTQS